MADPTKYTPGYSFSDFQTVNPSEPLPAPQVDSELANVSYALGTAVDAIKDVRRADGKLQNGIVTVDSLATGVSVGFQLRGQWALGANYIAADGVVRGTGFYRCNVAHTATNANRPDVDSVTWTYLFSIGDLSGAMASSTYDPTGIAADAFNRANHYGAISLADGNVTTSKIADNAVTTAKLADASVTTAKLPDGAVTGQKIADGVVAEAKLDTALAAKVNGKLDKIGGSMTGALILAADPATLMQAATKQYADGKATQLQPVSATVAANALTVGWTPDGKVSFRNSTLSNGAPVAVQVLTALSLVVPSGATLGTTNGQQAVLALLLLYNAGSPVLGIVNAASGLNLDETGLVSSTAISGASNSASTIYSASAVTSSPYRVLGTITVTQATAGTWAAAPTTVQGDGGKALSRALPVQSMVRLNTANGWGSTNTAVRRFSTVLVNAGADITYSDSATLGAAFTVNAPGIYAVSYADSFSSSVMFAVTKNCAANSTQPESLSASDILAHACTSQVGYSATISWVGYLAAGDVIRAHTNLSISSGSRAAMFTMTRIG